MSVSKVCVRPGARGAGREGSAPRSVSSPCPAQRSGAQSQATVFLSLLPCDQQAHAVFRRQSGQSTVTAANQGTAQLCSRLFMIISFLLKLIFVLA